jgi:uncharacterized membrane protein YdjX (TVP38/TMEM64 family)
MSRRLRLPLLGLGIAGLAILLGQLVRSQLGMEFSPSGIQEGVARLGWYGPIVFVALTIFRQFLAIPAWLILPAGGICFGTAAGTALGGGALIVSGCLKFGVARWVGREWVRSHLSTHAARIEQHVDRLGPVLIGISTAHPFGMLGALHWGAGLSSIRFAPFALALVLGAPVRAFAFSAFGAALVDPGASEFRTISLGFTALVLLPLAIPAVRRRLFPYA